MFVSLVWPVLGSIRTRCSDRPAPVVVDQSVAASAALIVEPQAVDAPNPEILWWTSERLMVTSPLCAEPPPQVLAPPVPVAPPVATVPPVPVVPPVALMPPVPVVPPVATVPPVPVVPPV